MITGLAILASVISIGYFYALSVENKARVCESPTPQTAYQKVLAEAYNNNTIVLAKMMVVIHDHPEHKVEILSMLKGVKS